MAFASSVVLGLAKDIPEIGRHYPVFIFEKNENPQNVLVTYVKLNENCQFEVRSDEGKKPFFDFYWLMDRERYKPVHKLIKSGIRERLQFVSKSDDLKRFTLRLNDLSELNQNLEATDITISAQKEGNHCVVKGVANVGTSKERERILLESIYSESKKTLMPPFRKVESITLKGVALDDNQKVERTFSAM